MIDMAIEILRCRVGAHKDKERCRYAAESENGYIRCGVDGSIRKKGCPCIKYEGRFLVRLRAAIRFIVYG